MKLQGARPFATYSIPVGNALEDDVRARDYRADEDGIVRCGDQRDINALMLLGLTPIPEPRDATRISQRSFNNG